MPERHAEGLTQQGVKSAETNTVVSVYGASLLACAGGSLDAILYLTHSHVFAGVMTGNAILAGTHIAEQDWAGCVRYLLPIIAYVCGILCIGILQTRGSRHHSVRRSLMLVTAAFLLLSFVPLGF